MKRKLTEAVPPTRAPAPAPVPAPVTPAARSSTADRTFSPSVQSSPAPLALRRDDNLSGGGSSVDLQAGGGANIAEIAALIEQQQDRVVGLLAAQQDRLEAKVSFCYSLWSFEEENVGLAPS